ncbi:MAG: hypothetical protein ABR974_14480 [Bacteroidales bacterium]|jgi:cytochrome c5
MKRIYVKYRSLAIIAIVLFAQSVLSQGQAQKEKASPLPEDVKKIFDTSCYPCHFQGGKVMALSMVNFSKWNGYTVSKSVSKASMICYALNKEKMPPKKIRKQMPFKIPSKEQTDLICKWAESLKAANKDH